jgi:hypothetical protein
MAAPQAVMKFESERAAMNDAGVVEYDDMAMVEAMNPAVTADAGAVMFTVMTAPESIAPAVVTGAEAMALAVMTEIRPVTAPVRHLGDAAHRYGGSYDRQQHAGEQAASKPEFSGDRSFHGVQP